MRFQKHINQGVIAAIISSSITLLGVVWVSVKERALLGAMVPTYLDVLVAFALTFGIYKKSRICAVLFLLHFLSGKIVHYEVVVNNPIAIVTSVVFGYFFIMGIYGIFSYHRSLHSVPKPERLKSDSCES